MAFSYEETALTEAAHGLRKGMHVWLGWPYYGDEDVEAWVNRVVGNAVTLNGPEGEHYSLEWRSGAWHDTDTRETNPKKTRVVVTPA